MCDCCCYDDIEWLIHEISYLEKENNELKYEIGLREHKKKYMECMFDIHHAWIDMKYKKYKNIIKKNNIWLI